MQNPIAIITGASRGLGKAAALHLAARGVDVIFTYRTQQAEAQQVVAQIEALGRRALALPLDLAESSSFGAFAAQVQAALAQHWPGQQVDFLLNNAGAGVHRSFAETTIEDFDYLMAIHFKGVFFLTQALLPLIKDGGRILNVSSGLTRFALEGYSAYAAMKGAVEVLSKYLAKELGARKIAVNVLAPGAVETDFGEGMVRDNAQVNQYIASQTALGRVGLPEDIGALAAALLSPECRWVNGQRIEASGGMFL